MWYLMFWSTGTCCSGHVVPGVLVEWYLEFWSSVTWCSGRAVVEPRGQGLPHLGPPAVELVGGQEPPGHGPLQAPLHLPAVATAAVQPEPGLH